MPNGDHTSNGFAELLARAATHRLVSIMHPCCPRSFPRPAPWPSLQPLVVARRHWASLVSHTHPLIDTPPDHVHNREERTSSHQA
jgi:hypothetical protein